MRAFSFLYVRLKLSLHAKCAARAAVKAFRMKQLLLLASLCALCSGCIKEEAQNAECDITGVDAEWLSANSQRLIGEPRVSNTRVLFTLKQGEGRTSLAPVFTLTPGAQLVDPTEGAAAGSANGRERNFETPQLYRAFSEDGQWHKDYTVAFNYSAPVANCDFEHYALDAKGKFYQWYEVYGDEALSENYYYWASGNAGYDFTGMAKQPDEYPTTVSPLGYSGNCIKLVTRDTGSFGQLVGMPIAAGNIFLGDFKAGNAILQPRKATQFGLPVVGGQPLRLQGWYKYTPGEVFTDDKKQPVPERRDLCDIYAVLYEINAGEPPYLDGDNVKDSPRIVAMAALENAGEPKEWRAFSADFLYREGKTFDEARFLNDGYGLAIVATSSFYGAYFEGAIGSTLYVDELKVVYAK